MRQWRKILWRHRWRGLIIILAALLSLEAFLRLALGLGSPLLFEKDPDVGYYYRANQDVHRFFNHIHINQFHQRNQDIWLSPSVAVRLLMVGDSVTFGGTLTGQSQTITALLEQQLHEATNKRFEVLNASAGSWGIGNQVA